MSLHLQVYMLQKVDEKRSFYASFGFNYFCGIVLFLFLGPVPKKVKTETAPAANNECQPTC